MLTREAGDIGAELLVNEHAGRTWFGAAANGLEHAFEDHVLGVGDRGCLLQSRVAVDPEHLLLEGTAMVEREDVQLSVVAKSHGTPPLPGACETVSEV